MAINVFFACFFGVRLIDQLFLCAFLFFLLAWYEKSRWLYLFW